MTATLVININREQLEQRDIELEEASKDERRVKDKIKLMMLEKRITHNERLVSNEICNVMNEWPKIFTHSFYWTAWLSIESELNDMNYSEDDMPNYKDIL